MNWIFHLGACPLGEIAASRFVHVRSRSSLLKVGNSSLEAYDPCNPRFRVSNSEGQGNNVIHHGDNIEIVFFIMSNLS